MENLNLEFLEGILSSGIEPNHYILLHLAQNTDISGVENIKISSWVQGLKRKGFLSDDFKVTEKGTKLLAGEFESKKDKLEKRKEKVEKVKTDFDLWWEAYPASDVIEVGGKVAFEYTRGLRAKKDDCAAKFEKILKEGEYTAEELIVALKYDVAGKIKASIKTGKNGLTYMQNSLTYLNQKSYEGAMKASKIKLEQKTRLTDKSLFD